MSNATLPNNTQSAQRQIEISNWKPYPKNTLQGFFSVTLESGLIIHKCMLHKKGTRSWIGFPAQEWTTDDGERRFTNIIGFVEGATETTRFQVKNRFEEKVLAAFKQQVPGVL